MQEISVCNYKGATILGNKLEEERKAEREKEEDLCFVFLQVHWFKVVEWLGAGGKGVTSIVSSGRFHGFCGLNRVWLLI